MGRARTRSCNSLVVQVAEQSDDAGTPVNFALAMSAADLQPQVTALLTGEDVPARRGDQNLIATAQLTPIPFDLNYLWAEQAFAIVAQPVEEVSFSLQSVSDLAVAIVDWSGLHHLRSRRTRLRRHRADFAFLDGVPPFLLLVEQFRATARRQYRTDLPRRRRPYAPSSTTRAVLSAPYTLSIERRNGRD